jgi:hypothetical protein
MVKNIKINEIKLNDKFINISENFINCYNKYQIIQLYNL